MIHRPWWGEWRQRKLQTSREEAKHSHVTGRHGRGVMLQRGVCQAQQGDHKAMVPSSPRFRMSLGKANDESTPGRIDVYAATKLPWGMFAVQCHAVEGSECRNGPAGVKSYGQPAAQRARCAHRHRASPAVKVR